MTRKGLLSAILLAVTLAFVLIMTGCGTVEEGESTWAAQGKDPAFTVQQELAADRLVQFGVYPQKRAESAVQNEIKTNVTIDPETGLWNECDNETMYARYDLETGYFVYAAKKDGVRQEEQYYMECDDALYLVEPLQWIVLETQGSDSIIISNKIIDGGRKYVDQYGECTWADSSLRDWLNGTGDYDAAMGDLYKTELNFINRAFTASEINKIETVSLPSTDNEIYGTDGGDDTDDKIYSLSESEFEEYFKTEGSEFNATAYATDYAKARGAEASGNSLAAWWLRDPGAKTFMLGVGRSGDVSDGGYSVKDTGMGIRPVLKVPTSALEKVPVQDSADNAGN